MRRLSTRGYFRSCMTLFLLAMAVTAAYLLLRERPERDQEIAQIFALLPGETQVLLAGDLRSEVDLPKLVGRVKQAVRDLPEGANSIASTETELGVSLEELASWFAPAGFVALFPLEGEDNLVGRSAETRPLDFVAGIAVVEEARLTEFIVKARQKSGTPAPSVQVIGGVPFQLTEASPGEKFGLGFYRGYLVLGSSVDALERLTARDDRLADDNQFRECLSRLEMRPGILGYAALRPNTSAALEVPELAQRVDDQTRQGVDSLEYAAMALDISGRNFTTTGYLKVDPASSSPLARALLGPTEVSGAGARFVPAEWAMYSALNLPYAWNVLVCALELSPAARTQVGMLPVGFTAMTGVALEDLWRVSTGEIGYSTNFIETLPEMLQQRALSSDPMGRTCALATLSIKDVEQARGVLETIYQKTGSRPQVVKTVDGIDILGFSQPGAHFCLVEAPSPCLVMAAGVDSLAALERALAVSKRPGDSVAGRDVFQDGLREAGGHLAMVDYSNWDPAVEALRAAEVPEEYRQQGDVLKSWLADLPSLEGTTFVKVEDSGLRWTSRGGGTTLLTGVGGFGAALLVPNFLRARGQGQLTACKSNLKNLGTGCEMYSTDHGGLYPPALENLTPNYLKTIPTCPAAGRDTYSGSYRVAERSASVADLYTMMCAGSHHSDSGIPADYPQYTAVQGLLVP
ncbi:MAG: hypothetical protein HY319_16710 [Armatimonadetes bacterium]|nr:hypothetical protein [Armatimonadota bacterium]